MQQKKVQMILGATGGIIYYAKPVKTKLQRMPKKSRSTVRTSIHSQIQTASSLISDVLKQRRVVGIPGLLQRNFHGLPDTDGKYPYAGRASPI